MVRSFILMKMVPFQAHQLIHSQETTNLVTDFTKIMLPMIQQKASFELVDGYLTADSWYRPKEILEAGTTWKASTEKISVHF